MAGVSRTSNLDYLKCPICLDFFDKAMKMTCGHILCGSCLGAYSTIAEPKCPLCREIFIPSASYPDREMEMRIKHTTAHCDGCSKQMTLDKLKLHSASCSKLQPNLHFVPVAATSQPVPRNVPNRSTFQCPYCGLKNLETAGLVKHCNDDHKHSPAQVVCPVCASMPWGDPQQQSGNFLQHLNLRHKFEYDTYVDYEHDDDSMLQAAIKASMSQQ